MSIAWQNYRWAEALLHTLTLIGCRHFFIAPGSRNAPLSMAALRMADANPTLRCFGHFDERGLGFLALGAAKASEQPVVVITTSGSAVANLLPAAVEASQLDIPLIIVTADRPPELINVGANQAIVQPGLFSHFVRLFDDLPLAPETAKVSELFSHSAARWQTSLRENPGPIHLNVPLREPLYADIHQPDSGYPQHPWATVSGDVSLVSSPSCALNLSTDTVIIAGQLTGTEAKAVLAISEQQGWPILADISSQLRLLEHPNVISTAHFIAQTKTLDDVDSIVQFGGRLVSKPLNQWLDRFTGNYVLISASPQCLDPSGKAQQIRSQWPKWASYVADNRSEKGQLNQKLQLKSANIEEKVKTCVGSLFSEYRVAQTLSELVPSNHLLMLGNSLSIRVFDQVATTRIKPPDIFCSRGASGIDGLIATSVGLSIAKQQAVTSVIGDVSALYDLNSLALLRQIQQTFILVILNNDGGQIFSMLAAVDQTDVFDRAFSQPHGRNFADFCQGFAVQHRLVDNIESLSEAYLAACLLNEPCVIEVSLPPNAFTHHNARLQRCWHD